MPKTQKKSGAPSRYARRGRRARKPAAARPTVWWISADVEICTVCQQGYAYGTGYTCVGCDGAVCGFCIEERGKEFWCPGC